MKKLLPLALIAALSLPAVACSDGDSCPTDMKLISLMKDLNTVGPQDASGKVKVIDITAESAAQDCMDFAKTLEPVMTNNKDITKEKLSADWDAYKNAGALCKVDLGILIAAQGVKLAINYDTIKANASSCSTGVAGLAAESVAQLGEQAQTLEGWAGILNQASKVTAAAAEQQKSGN